MKRIGASEPNEPVKAIAIRNVTEVSAMPRGRKPEGEQALSNAERQARYRARHMAPPSPVATRPRRPLPIDAVAPSDGVTQSVNCCHYRPAYADWLAALPDSLQGSSTAEALEAIVELDLTDLAGVEPPRGYGRD
jgi:hypothetical protein